MVNRTRVEGGGCSKHDIITLYDKQAGCNIIVDVLLYNHSAYYYNTNTMTRIKGENVGIMILFDLNIYFTRYLVDATCSTFARRIFYSPPAAPAKVKIYCMTSQVP